MSSPVKSVGSPTSGSGAASPAGAASPRATTPTAATSPTLTASQPPSTAAACAPATTAAEAPAAPPAAPPAAQTPISDPKVAELHAMFPSIEPAVIEVILESVGGSQDRAIESLLQMSDPEFKPDTEPVDLDAEFARALAVQDEEEARARQERRGSQRGTGSTIPAVLPYQPRVRRPRRPDGTYDGEHERMNPPVQGNDAMAQIEERVANIAEVGRQTFSTFLTRAKAKYAEYQVQTQANADLRAQQSHEQQAGLHQGLQRQVSPQRGGGLWADSMEAPQRTASRSTSLSSQVSSQSGDAQPLSRRWNPNDTLEEAARPAGRRSPAGGAASPDKPAPASSKAIDLAKLGFLPKKRVDLMSSRPSQEHDRDPNPDLPSSPSTPANTRSLVDQIPKTPPSQSPHHTLGDSDDDDDLEYTKNPFDEK